jgi:hypothetical protein
MAEPTPTIQNTLEQALIKSLDGIQKTGTELVEALYQQAPEVVEQLLMWHAVESLIQCIAAILALGIPFAVYKVACYIHQKLEVATWGDEFGFWLPVTLSGIVSFAIGFGTFFEYINIKWLKIWLAPKVYLLEYLADMMK